jgi:hypothetical protein
MGALSPLLSKARSRGMAYTSLDAMKLLAIVSMTADHIGFFFFPDDMWWRAVGRTVVPIWFFFVGYSRARQISPSLLLFAVLMIPDRLWAGVAQFPANALFSVIFCRLLLNLCNRYKWLPKHVPALIAASVLLSFYTMLFFEYGTVAFMFALIGRMVREQERQHFGVLMGFTYVLFLAWQAAIFDFSLPQWVLVALGTAWAMQTLSTGRNTVIWPDWSASAGKRFIAVLSRNTIPYYFAHRVLLEVLSALLHGGLHFQLKLY